MSQRICSIEGCENLCRARGWCSTHYMRWYQHGDPMVLLRDPTRTDEQRFWENVDRSGGENACWVWTGSRLRGRHGELLHGFFSVRAVPVYAHRWIWEHHHGPIPEGLEVRHSCDNPPCVNFVHHLLLGTHQDNIDDAVERDRIRHGSDHYRAKLTEADIPIIREAVRHGETHAVVAERFGVTRENVSAIMRGRSWRHVP